MKRVLYLLLIVFILSGCSIIETAFEPVSEIELINLQNGEKEILANNSEASKIILKAIKSKNKSEQDTSNYTAYELLVKKTNNIDYYKLFFDLKNKKAYVTNKGDIFAVDDNDTKMLLLNESFYYVYIDETMYDSFLDYNEKKFTPSTEYKWTYRDINGHYVKKEGIIKTPISKEEIVIRENDILDIAYEKAPDSQTIRLYKDENLVTQGTNLSDVLKKLTEDGEYRVESYAQWLMRDNSEYYGSKLISFTINIDKPANIEIITKENYPGNILLLSVKNVNKNETLKLKTDAVKTPIESYSYKNKYMYICPIDLDTQPGTYDLNLIVNEGKSNEYTISSLFEVKSKAFKTQYLTVTEEMNETNNDNTAIYEFVQLVKPARTKSSEEKLWEGTFIMPVEGELTTDFAEIRYVNNQKSSSRHSGIDLAAPRGTEIKAPNNGMVVFAMEGLLSPGNTVVIDHGMGLFTSYYHLDTIDVTKGKSVTKGDIIGTVGTTGFSTGPHLHYAVSIYNTYVNPYQTLSGIID